MNKEDLGKHFIKDDIVYEAIGYTDKPTMELINRETGNRLSVVIDSDYANEFELVPEEKKLNLDHTQYSLIPSWFRDEELVKVINNNFERHKQALKRIVDYINNMENKR